MNENKIPSLKGFEIGNTINDNKDISVPKLSIEETSKFTKDLEKNYKEKMNTFNLVDIIAKEIIEAKIEALKKGILANRLIINEKYSFIKSFLFGTRHTPPMIAGMHTIFSDLPEDIDYVVFYSKYCDEVGNDDIVQKIKKLEKENKQLKKANKRLMKILKGKAKWKID